MKNAYSRVIDILLSVPDLKKLCVFNVHVFFCIESPKPELLTTIKQVLEDFRFLGDRLYSIYNMHSFRIFTPTHRPHSSSLPNPINQSTKFLLALSQIRHWI